MSKSQNDLPLAAKALLADYNANWLPVAQVEAAGFEAMDAGFTGFIHFPDPPLSPEQVAEFRARWRACWAEAEDAEAGEAEGSPSPDPPPPVAPANPYPLRSGNEHSFARRQVALALAEVRRLERYVEGMDAPLLLGYAGVAFTALEHLERALEQSPNPYPLDPEISADGP